MTNEEKIILAYKYSLLKETNLILSEMERYKLLEVCFVNSSVKKYIVDYVARDGDVGATVAWIERNPKLYQQFAYTTPDDAIKHGFLATTGVSFEEMKMWLAIAGEEEK